METYKAEIVSVQLKKMEKPSKTMAEGTPYISVLFKPTHKDVYDAWQQMPEETSLMGKAYYISNNMVGNPQKSILQWTKENMERDLGYVGNGSKESLEELIGLERILKTEIDGQYENIKYINDPNYKGGGRVKLNDVKEEDFMSIWNGQ